MKAKSSITALLLSTFCFAANAQTTIDDSFISGGLVRYYRLYIPAVYDGSTQVPLVFNLHGYTSDNLQQDYYANFKPIADTANFILVLPNGTLDGNGQRFWNAFGTSSVDDVGFLSNLIDTVSAHYNVDPDRIYSTGMSNGGFMSYDLACYLSDRIAAVASVTGSMVTTHNNNCSPIHPVPVMEIHGTADQTVQYNGSPGVLPIDDLVESWATRNNCNLTPMFTTVPNTVTNDGCTAEHYLYPDGDNGSTVEHYKIIGGGHTWPGAPIAIGVTCMDFDACEEIWRFFKQYTLGELMPMAVDPQNQTLTFEIFPVPSSDNITIQFTYESEKEISVFDYSGKVISKFNSLSRNVEIELKTSGIYFVEVVIGEQRITRRIVKN